MSAALEQLKVAYEVLHLTPEEIAEDQEMDLVAVKAGLMSVSSKYRKACGKEEEGKAELNFSDEQAEDAMRVIHELMLGSEDDHIRLKAAMYVRDDKKGRKDVVKQMGGQQFNILMFNEAMQKVRNGANELKQRFIDQTQGKIIDA